MKDRHLIRIIDNTRLTAQAMSTRKANRRKQNKMAKKSRKDNR